MRRLYSTFAGGWPGAGLLLLRLVVGYMLVARASSVAWSAAPANAAIVAACSLICGILLVPGLWTPIAGMLLALLETAALLTRTADEPTALLLGAIGGALAMLGPGLWSVDARLFGWKRVEAPSRNHSSARS